MLVKRTRRDANLAPPGFAARRPGSGDPMRQRTSAFQLTASIGAARSLTAKISSCVV